MATDASTLLAAIEAQFLAASAGAKQVVETPGFRVHLWTTPDAFYRNVAVPIEPLTDWDAVIPLMAAAFKGHWRVPTLEYLEERWPALGPALERDGYALEARLTAMVCDADTAERASSTRTPAEVRHLSGRTTKPALRAYLTALHDAFEPRFAAKVGESDAARLKLALREGRTRIAIVEDEFGQAIAGANLIGVGGVQGVAGPVAELSGVWTAEAVRGRGLARALTGALLGRFFADGGGLVWLAADNERAAGLYAGLGFRPIGHQLRYSRRHT
jgi:ribosomal protein S18 acetylase RimI-like enzyme